MIPVPDALVSAPCFEGVPVGVLRASSRAWSWMRATPGEVLWRQGERVEEIGLLWMGEVVARAGGVEVGRLYGPQLIGEAGAFVHGATRLASMEAVEPCVMLMLPLGVLRAMRAQHSPIYEALLHTALTALEARVRATSLAVSRTRPPGLREVPGERDGAALPTTPCPPMEGLLRAQNGLHDAPEAVIAALAAAFQRSPLAEGQTLCNEGDEGDGVFLVADGTVDVFRGLGTPDFVRVTTLGPGALIGVNTLVRPGPRTASCVASRPGWIYRLDTGRFARLDPEARLRLRECMLASLAGQLRICNDQLCALTPAAVPHPQRRSVARAS